MKKVINIFLALMFFMLQIGLGDCLIRKIAYQDDLIQNICSYFSLERFNHSINYAFNDLAKTIPTYSVSNSSYREISALNKMSYFYKIMNTKNVRRRIALFIERADEMDEYEKLILVPYFLQYIKDDESIQRKLIKILLDKKVNIWTEFGYIDDFLNGANPKEVFKKASSLLSKTGISLNNQNSMQWLQRDFEEYKYNIYRMKNRIKELKEIFPNRTHEYISTRLRLEELFKSMGLDLEKKEDMTFRSTPEGKAKLKDRQSFVVDLVARGISLTEEEYNELDSLLQKAKGLNIHIVDDEIYYWECLDVYDYVDIRKVGVKDPVIENIRFITVFRVAGSFAMTYYSQDEKKHFSVIKNKKLINYLTAQRLYIDKITDTVLHIQTVNNNKHSLYSFNGEEFILLIDKADKIFEFKSLSKARYKKYIKNGMSYLCRIEKNRLIPVLEGVSSIGKFIKHKNDLYITYNIENKKCLGKIINDKAKMCLYVDNIMFYGDVLICVNQGSMYYFSMEGDVLVEMPKNLIECEIGIKKPVGGGCLVIAEKSEKQSLYIIKDNQVVELKSDISGIYDICVNDSYKNHDYISYRKNGKMYFSVIIGDELKDLIVREDKKDELKKDEDLLDDSFKFMSAMRELDREFEMQSTVERVEQTKTALYVIYKQLDVRYLVKIQDEEVVYEVCLEKCSVYNEIEEFEGAVYLMKTRSMDFYALLKIEKGKIVWGRKARWFKLIRLSDQDLYFTYNIRDSESKEVINNIRYSKEVTKIAKIENGEIHKFDMKGHQIIDRFMKIGSEVYFSYSSIYPEYSYKGIYEKPLFKLGKIANNKISYFDMKEIGNIIEEQDIRGNIYIKNTTYSRYKRRHTYSIIVVIDDKVINLISNAYHIEKIELDEKGAVNIIYYNYDDDGYDKVVSAKRLSLNISKGKIIIKDQELEIIELWSGGSCRTKHYVKYNELGDNHIQEITEKKVLQAVNRYGHKNRLLRKYEELASEVYWESLGGKWYLDRVSGDKIVEIISKKKFDPKEEYPYVCINDKQIYFKDTTINEKNVFIDKNGKRAQLLLKAIVPYYSEERRVSLAAAKFILDPANRHWIRNFKAYPNKANIFLSNMLNIDNYGDFIKYNFGSKFIQGLLFNMLEDEEISALFEKTPNYFLDLLVDAHIGEITDTSVSASLRRILNTNKRVKNLQRYIKDILTVHEYIGDIEKDILLYRIPNYLNDDRMLEILKNWDIKNRLSLGLQNKRRLKMFDREMEAVLMYLKRKHKLNEFIMKEVLEFKEFVKEYLIQNKKMLENGYFDYKRARSMLLSA